MYESTGRYYALFGPKAVMRADTLAGLSADLRGAGFGIERAYQAYDLDAPFADGAAMLVAVARSGD